MATGIDNGMDFHVARVAMGSGLLAVEDSVVAKHDHLLEELIRYKMERKQLKKLKLEMDPQWS